MSHEERFPGVRGRVRMENKDRFILGIWQEAMSLLRCRSGIFAEMGIDECIGLVGWFLSY